MGRGPRSHRRRARRLLDERHLAEDRALALDRDEHLAAVARPQDGQLPTDDQVTGSPSRKSTSPGSSWTSSDSPHTRARSSSDRSAKRGTCRNRSSIRLTRPGGSGGGTSRCAATGLQRQRPSCRMTRGRCHAGYLAPPAGCAPQIARHRGPAPGVSLKAPASSVSASCTIRYAVGPAQVRAPRARPRRSSRPGARLDLRHQGGHRGLSRLRRQRRGALAQHPECSAARRALRWCAGSSAVAPSFQAGAPVPTIPVPYGPPRTPDG